MSRLERDGAGDALRSWGKAQKAQSECWTRVMPTDLHGPIVGKYRQLSRMDDEAWTYRQIASDAMADAMSKVETIRKQILPRKYLERVTPCTFWERSGFYCNLPRQEGQFFGHECFKVCLTCPWSTRVKARF